MKKYICLLLTALVISKNLYCCAETAESIFNTYLSSGVVFSDLEGYEWAAEAAEELSKVGIVSGAEGFMFMPEKSVTRKEYIKMICGACGIVKTDAVSSYSDVPSDDWGYVYVSSAKEAGLLDIYGSESLDGDTLITREDMAYLAFKALSFIDVDTSGDNAPTFSDDGEISDYARRAVYALKGEDIINGRENGEFDPNGTALRAEAAKIIYGVYKTAISNYIQ